MEFIIVVMFAFVVACILATVVTIIDGAIERVIRRRKKQAGIAIYLTIH